MHSSPRLLVRVEISSSTQFYRDKIKNEKDYLSFLHKQNRLLKKLCFFEGKIQSEAQKELNSNKRKILSSIQNLQKLNSLFSNEYEKDYQISCQKAFEALNNKINPTYPNTTEKFKHPDIVKLDSILSQAKSINYLFNHEIRTSILERIENLS